jgi:hypothetical protein
MLVLLWNDPRLQMPALWNITDPWVYQYGVDIYQATQVFNVQGIQPAIWVPDIIFPDASDKKVYEQYLKLFPDGSLVSLVHYVMKLSQPRFQYRDFPTDRQSIELRYFGFTLYSSQMQLMALGSPVEFIYPIGDQNGAASFESNPIWTFISASGSYQDIKFSEEYDPRSTALIFLEIERKSGGILSRLGIPISVLALLAALAFWASPDQRVTTTITLLLTLAALYLVVFSIIPMVGRSTRFDTFVLAMFITLASCTAIHQVVCTMISRDKLQTWPMRKLYVRILEYIGRVTIVPFTGILYITQFGAYYSDIFIISMYTICAMFIVTVSLFDIPAIRKTLVQAMNELSEKGNEDKISMSEIYFYNMYKYNKWSPVMLFVSRDTVDFEKTSGGTSFAKKDEEKSHDNYQRSPLLHGRKTSTDKPNPVKLSRTSHHAPTAHKDLEMAETPGEPSPSKSTHNFVETNKNERLGSVIRSYALHRYDISNAAEISNNSSIARSNSEANDT